MDDVVEDDVSARLIRLETDAGYIRREVDGLTADMRDLRSEVRTEIKEVKGEIKSCATSCSL